MTQFSKTYTFLSTKSLFCVCVCVCVCTVCALSSVFYTTFLHPHVVLRLLFPCLSHSYMNVLNLFGKSWNHYWSWNSGRMVKVIFLLSHCACSQRFTQSSLHSLPGIGSTVDRDRGYRQICSLRKTQGEDMGIKQGVVNKKLVLLLRHYSCLPDAIASHRRDMCR